LRAGPRAREQRLHLVIVFRCLEERVHQGLVQQVADRAEQSL